MKNVGVILGVIAILVVAGFFITSRQSQYTTLPQSGSVKSTPTEGQSVSDDESTENVSQFQGKRLANNYYEFTTEDFEKLKAQGQPILLYFYANWCPTCAVQEPVMIKFMNAGGSAGKVAFRVNYNDSETDKSEKNLADEFTIAYQHTFVALDFNGQVVAFGNGQQSEANLKNLFSKI